MSEHDSGKRAADAAMQAPSGPVADVEWASMVLEQAPDVVIVTDRSGVIRVWNRRATEVFGFSADEAIAAGLDVIIPAALQQAHWTAFDVAMKSGKAKTQGRAILTRAVHKDGGRLYLELSFAVLSNEAGEAIGAIAIGRDVTESRRAAADRAKA
jgi:PAS domain S-box-containing protein